MMTDNRAVYNLYEMTEASHVHRSLWLCAHVPVVALKSCQVFAQVPLKVSSARITIMTIEEKCIKCWPLDKSPPWVNDPLLKVTYYLYFRSNRGQPTHVSARFAGLNFLAGTSSAPDRCKIRSRGHDGSWGLAKLLYCLKMWSYILVLVWLEKPI